MKVCVYVSVWVGILWVVVDSLSSWSQDMFYLESIKKDKKCKYVFQLIQTPLLFAYFWAKSGGTQGTQGTHVRS